MDTKRGLKMKHCGFEDGGRGHELGVSSRNRILPKNSKSSMKVSSADTLAFTL